MLRALLLVAATCTMLPACAGRPLEYEDSDAPDSGTAADLARSPDLLAAQLDLARAPGHTGAAVCCDGTLSPSCLCGRPLRGCCSWHGGVCGCD